MLPLPNDLLLERGSMTGTGTGTFVQDVVGLRGDEVKVTSEEGTTSTNSGLTTGGNGSEFVVGVGENAKNEAHAQGVPSSVSGYDNGCGGGGDGDNNSSGNNPQQPQVGDDLIRWVTERVHHGNSVVGVARNLVADLRAADEPWLMHFTSGWLKGNPGRNVNVTTDDWLESILGLQPLSYYKVDLLTRCIKLTNAGRKVKFDGVKMGNHGLRVSAPKSSVISTCYRSDRTYEVGFVANKMRRFLVPSTHAHKCADDLETVLPTDSAPPEPGLMPHANFSIPMNPGLGADGNVTEEFHEQGGGSAVHSLLNWVDAHGCVGSNKSLRSFEKVVRGFQSPLQQDNMHWLDHFVYIWTAAGPSPPVTRVGWLEMACTFPPQFGNDEPSRLLNFNQVELLCRCIIFTAPGARLSWGLTRDDRQKRLRIWIRNRVVKLTYRFKDLYSPPKIGEQIRMVLAEPVPQEPPLKRKGKGRNKPSEKLGRGTKRKASGGVFSEENEQVEMHTTTYPKDLEMAQIEVQGDNNRAVGLPPNIVLVQNLVNEHPQGALVEAGRVQEQTPAGVQMVHESLSDQEVVGNRMRFMQTPQMTLQPEGILGPNISHGLLEFIHTPSDPNARNSASPV